MTNFDNNDHQPSSAIELFTDHGLDIELFSLDQLERIQTLSSAVLAIVPQSENRPVNDRDRQAALVTVYSIAEQYPTLVSDIDSLRVSDTVQHDDSRLLEVIHRLYDAGVTDISQFISEAGTEFRFSETDNATEELVQRLEAALGNVREYQQQVNTEGYADEAEENEEYVDDEDDDEYDDQEDAEDSDDSTIGSFKF